MIDAATARVQAQSRKGRPRYETHVDSGDVESADGVLRVPADLSHEVEHFTETHAVSK